MWSSTDVIPFSKYGLEDGAFLVTMWLARRRDIVRALERQAWDVEAIEKLSAALGSPLVLDEREELIRGGRMADLLDRLITSELACSTGLFGADALVRTLTKAWLFLEVRFAPDDQGWLVPLRERLTVAAEQREIDLRDLGV